MNHHRLHHTLTMREQLALKDLAIAETPDDVVLLRGQTRFTLEMKGLITTGRRLTARGRDIAETLWEEP